MYIERIVNAQTGEIEDRPASEELVKEIEADIELKKAQAAILAEKEAARQSAIEKLAALGLTEAEIQALAG